MILLSVELSNWSISLCANSTGGGSSFCSHFRKKTTVMDTESNSMTSKKAQNNFRRQAIRDLYYNEIKPGSFPTINELSPKVNHILGHQIQPFALVDIFKSLGFEHSIYASTNTPELIETPESRFKRIKYLKNIKAARAASCPIVYVLMSATTVGGVSILVLVAAFESKVLKESISVVPAEVFTCSNLRYWLKNTIINKIPFNYIIALNESTYERFVSDVPNYSASSNMMKSWLHSHNIPFGEDYTKPELYEVVQLHKKNFFFREFGVKAICIPDDNPGFNPLEIVWYNMEPYDYKNINDIRLKSTAKAVTIVGMLGKLKLNKLSVASLNGAISALFGCMQDKIWQSCMRKVIEYEEKIIKTEQRADAFENNDISENMETETQTINTKADTLRDALRNFTCDDDSN